MEFKIPVEIFGSEYHQIKRWYDEGRIKPGSQDARPYYKSVYFFDGEFWPIKIPVSFGTGQLACNELIDMPVKIYEKLQSTPHAAMEFYMHVADTLDFCMGISEVVRKPGLLNFGKQLLASGREELESAQTLLSEPRPNSRAMLRCRDALEQFLKAGSALEGQLDENGARDISHDLGKAVEKLTKTFDEDALLELKDDFSIFPKFVSERYKPQDHKPNELWKAFQMTQSIGAFIVRRFSNAGYLDQFLIQLDMPNNHAI